MSNSIVLRHPRDVSDLVSSGVIKGGNSRFVIVIALAGIFMDAYDFTSIAFGLTYIQQQFAFTPLELGLASGVILIGALAGSLSGGALMDKIGREKVFTADLIMLIAATVLCALAPNAWVFILARFVMGFAVGVDYPVALSFVAEYTSRANKGRSLNFYAPVWYSAVTLTYVLLLVGYFIFDANGFDIAGIWRWVVGFGVLPAVFVLILRRKYLTESPTWLAQNADLHRVAEVLRKAYKIDVTVADDAVLSLPRKQEDKRGSFGRLWSPTYRPRTVLALIINFCQGLEYYAVGFSIGLITQQILGDNVLNGIIGPLVFNLIFGILGGIAAITLAHRVGIRLFAMLGFATTTISVLLVNLLGHQTFPGAIWLACLFLGIFIFGHAAGPGTQAIVLTTMSYPTSFRGAGVGFAQVGNRAGGALGLIFWPILTAALGLNALAVLAVVPFIGFLALLLLRWDPSKTDVDAEDYTHTGSLTTNDPSPEGNPA